MYTDKFLNAVLNEVFAGDPNKAREAAKRLRDEELADIADKEDAQNYAKSES